MSDSPSKMVPSGGAGDRLLKVAVVILCSINAAMWEFYTESRVMALLWGATAIAFVVWIAKDMRR
jgi:membrane protein YdbS with pleckstrin-like domain